MRKVNLPLVIGSFFIVIVLIPTIISFFYTPYDPTEIKIINRFQPPSRANWLGADQFGRDVLSRVMTGGQTSLVIGLLSVGLGMVIGVILGAAAGFYGRWFDELMMRLAEVFYAFPSILLALLAVAVFGPGENTVLAAIAVANIPVFMKITRAAFLQQSKFEYVQAARAVGASDFRIMFRHILPNCSRLILVQATASFAGALLSEASLSYLGVGVQPPLPSWGRMLKEAQSFGSLAPWTVVFPGLAIALIVLGLNLLADGLKTKGN
ncbi:MAG TPA: ABC transporter permease [Firmicutes bacterium]|jgi:peptide/nickel transport system permease protein|nr:ABC transporter permease [Bacillota bacterium]